LQAKDILRWIGLPVRVALAVAFTLVRLAFGLLFGMFEVQIAIEAPGDVREIWRYAWTGDDGEAANAR
jgi:hypothetical protein